MYIIILMDKIKSKGIIKGDKLFYLVFSPFGALLRKIYKTLNKSEKSFQKQFRSIGRGS